MTSHSIRTSLTCEMAAESIVEGVPWAVPGARIRIGHDTTRSGHKHVQATVRYLGSVEGQDGEWVGLEWDDIGRGKHNGCFKGKRYFSCRNTEAEACASFVRYSALIKQGVDGGIGLETAIVQRYKSPSVPEGESLHVVAAEKKMEEISSRDGALIVAGFSNMNISSCGVSSKVVSGFMSNITSLDLSCTLLSSWKDVLGCVSTFQNLRVLNLSENILAWDVRSGEYDDSCGHVETLVLNGCHMTNIETLQKLDRVFPRLTELFLYDNKIALHENAAQQMGLSFDRLEVLDVGKNGIRSWANIEASIGELPRLRCLNLQENSIQSVLRPDGSGQQRFRRLVHLNLAGNMLATWDDIQSVATLLKVSELRFSENPLCTDEIKDRLIAIGRFKMLTWVNGSDISVSERRDSEIAFIRDLDAFVPGNISNHILEERVGNLEAQYGVSRNSSGITAGQRDMSLASGMVQIRLVLEDGCREVRKKIPSTMTIDKMKRLIEKLLGIKSEVQVLTLVRTSPSGDDLSEVISHEAARDIAFFLHSDRSKDGGFDACWTIRVEQGDKDLERNLRRANQEALIRNQEADAEILTNAQIDVWR